MLSGLRQIRQQQNVLQIRVEWQRGQRMASDNRLTLEIGKKKKQKNGKLNGCLMFDRRARASHIDKLKIVKIINQISWEHMFAITFFASFNRLLSFVFWHFRRQTFRQCSVYEQLWQILMWHFHRIRQHSFRRTPATVTKKKEEKRTDIFSSNLLLLFIDIWCLNSQFTVVVVNVVVVVSVFGAWHH